MHKMKRHFFVSDDLDELKAFEDELESQGIGSEQLHVFSLDDAGVQGHHLHDVQSILKKDIIHSGQYGLALGILAAAGVLAAAWFFGWYQTAAGWVPFLFLAVVLLGFLTWEGGFIGIQTFNVNFKRFRQELEEGRHVFFADLADDDEPLLDRVSRAHPNITRAGVGRSTPHWIITWQRRLKRFFLDTMP